MNRWRAFSQLVLSRFREFFREPEVIFWVYGFPLILAIGLSIAFSQSKPEPPVVDIQGSASDPEVKELMELLRADKLKVEAHGLEECRARLRQGKTSLYVIPSSKAITSQKGDELVYAYDQTRPEGVLARYWLEALVARHRLGSLSPPEQFFEEPGSRYIDFLIPGLMGMNLMGGGLFGVGFVLVDIRVRKLFKRFLATPMNRVDFLLAIFTARTVFLIPEMLALLALGWFVFGVPLGNPLTLLLVILLGALMFDAIGLLLGSRTEKTETASGLVNRLMLPQDL